MFLSAPKFQHYVPLHYSAFILLVIFSSFTIFPVKRPFRVSVYQRMVITGH